MNWKSVKGYEGRYLISDTGIVKSLPNLKNNRNGQFLTKEKILKPCKTKAGYFVVSLSNGKKMTSKYIHQLVAESFLNHEYKGHKNVVDHIDENKENNNLKNLRIISNRINISRGFKNKHSKYIGVTKCNQTKKWLSAIVINGKRKHIGRFDLEYDAYIAYQNKLKEINANLL